MPIRLPEIALLSLKPTMCDFIKSRCPQRIAIKKAVCNGAVR